MTLESILGHANLRTIQRSIYPQEEPQKEAMRLYAEAMCHGSDRRQRPSIAIPECRWIPV
jgi:hypothetical protein